MVATAGFGFGVDLAGALIGASGFLRGPAAASALPIPSAPAVFGALFRTPGSISAQPAGHPSASRLVRRRRPAPFIEKRAAPSTACATSLNAAALSSAARRRDQSGWACALPDVSQCVDIPKLTLKLRIGQAWQFACLRGDAGGERIAGRRCAGATAGRFRLATSASMSVTGLTAAASAASSFASSTPPSAPVAAAGLPSAGLAWGLRCVGLCILWPAPAGGLGCCRRARPWRRRAGAAPSRATGPAKLQWRRRPGRRRRAAARGSAGAGNLDRENLECA